MANRASVLTKNRPTFSSFVDWRRAPALRRRLSTLGNVWTAARRHPDGLKGLRDIAFDEGAYHDALEYGEDYLGLCERKPGSVEHVEALVLVGVVHGRLGIMTIVMSM